MGLLTDIAEEELEEARGQTIPHERVMRILGKGSAEGPPPAAVKEVQGRAKTSADLAKEAYTAVEKLIDHVEKNDGPNTTVSPKSLNKLHHASADLRTIADVAKQVADGYPKRRA